MDIEEGISSLLGQCEHLLVVIRQIIGVAPGQQDQLAIAVDAIVEDPVTLQLKIIKCNSYNIFSSFHGILPVHNRDWHCSIYYCATAA